MAGDIVGFAGLDGHGQRERLRAMFRDLVRTTRDKLYEIYASSLSDDDKRRGKAETIAAMKAAYETAKAGEPGLGGYEPLDP